MPKSIEKKLPEELKFMVGELIALFGEMLKAHEGSPFYQKIEKIRKKTLNLRGGAWFASFKNFQNIVNSYEKSNRADQLKIAKAFAIKLELINLCEIMYRAHRLGAMSVVPTKQRTTKKSRIMMVSTAHPTEARSPEFLSLLEELKGMIEETKFLQNPREAQLFTIQKILTFLWKAPIHRSSKPSVVDEAEYLNAFLLKSENVHLLLELNSQQDQVYLRTWVGGDKDGHPDIDEKVMLQSLEVSRKHCLNFFKTEILLAKKNYQLISLQDSKAKRLLVKIETLLTSLGGFERIKKNDFLKIGKLKKKISEISILEDAVLSRNCKNTFSLLLKFFDLFPALVLPLELREDAELLRVPRKEYKNLAIFKMLKSLRSITEKGEMNAYVRALILSMTESEEDLFNALELVQMSTKDVSIPIVPLFEKRQALEDASKILKTFLSDSVYSQYLQKKGYQEIMLGYSDSSKEMGVLPSRVLLCESIHKLDVEIHKKLKIDLIFFHGSGGSVARGGGSFSEQSSWFSEGALNPYKSTFQGEMVPRIFSNAEILRREIQKIQNIQKEKFKKKNMSFSKSLVSYVSEVSEHYQNLVSDPTFLKLVREATPYTSLDQLNMGSRPSKRRDLNGVQDLRSIPWILCWTQTRLLFPTWFGVASSFYNQSQKTQKSLASEFRKHPLLSSFVKQMAFTLAKVELEVFKKYLELSSCSQKDQNKYFKILSDEYALALKFIRLISGKQDLLWFRPWLGESIHYRSPSIHPLNAAQIVALKNKDYELFRSTITGISSGMMTTG